MKCRSCGARIPFGGKVCPECGETLPYALGGISRATRIVVVFVSWVIALLIVGFGIYKIWFRVADYRLTREYTRGARRPSVSEIVMEDHRPGHSVTFYGKDGDSIYFETLDMCVPFCGGVARIELADSGWFGEELEETDSAEVEIAATLISAGGTKTRLPVLEFTVDAPGAPVTVVSPAEEDIAVNTSAYTIALQVVPGSKVNINGTDLTAQVDRDGNLSVSVNVLPIGDNIYSVLVDTDHHKQTRREIVIYRQKMEIAVEVDSSMPTATDSDTVLVSGKCDLGAEIQVDSKYVENSLYQNDETGEYYFMAKMTSVGENKIYFRAVQEGKTDTVLTLSVDYLPNLDAYSRIAWAMDYKGLCQMFDQWKGRPFKCVGKAVDLYTQDDIPYVIMDVGPEGTEQLLILRNYSKLTQTEPGKQYTAWADCDGRMMYQGHYYPVLNIRYMFNK